MKKLRSWALACMLTVCSFLALATADSAMAAVTYADGEYTVSYQVMKDTSDEISATAEYMVDPATIIINEGSAHAEITLKNSSWWQEFQVKSAATGTYRDVTAVSENADQQTRVVKFAVEDLDAILDAKIHIIVTGIPGFEYDNRYDIRFQFDTSVIPTASKPSTDAQAPVADEKQVEGQQGAPATSEAPAPDVSASPEAPVTAPVNGVDDPAAADSQSKEAEDAVTTTDSDVEERIESGDHELSAVSEEDAAESPDPASETEAAVEVETYSERGSSPALVIVIIVLAVIVLGAGLLLFTKRSRK